MAQDPTRVVTRTPLHRTNMTREEIIAWFDRRRKAYDDRDARMVAADYAPHAVGESAMGGIHEGRDAIETVLQACFDAFVDMKATSDRLVIDGESVVQIRSVEGTHVGVFLGLQPTGKPFH